MNSDVGRRSLQSPHTIREELLMKRYLLPVLTLFFLNSLLTGCLGHGMVVVHRSPAPERTVVVKEKRLPKRVVKRKRAPRPTGKYEWVKGHWSWDGNVGKYVWVPGHWERQQTAKRWVPGHYEWKVRGRHRVKVWVKGHWEKVGQTQPSKVRQTQPQTLRRPLPARPPRSANARPNPRRGHIWVKGHWKWTPNAGKYVWSDGRYEKKKRNMRWLKGHYKWKEVGNQQIQIGVRGRWVR